MKGSRLIVSVVAPIGTAEPFRVNIRNREMHFEKDRTVHEGERAVFCLPEGSYMIEVSADSSLSPEKQRKWICLKDGCDCCFSVVFRREEPIKDRINVCFLAQDVLYPNIIPINGGITIMGEKNYTVHFENGISAKMTLPVGKYTLKSCSIPGYRDATAEDFVITRDTQYIEIHLKANGVLKVNVVDEVNTPITDGKLQLSNATGTLTFGRPQNIVNGKAFFRNVPYHDYPAINTWIRQDGSDEDHGPITEPQAVALTETPQTEEIINLRKRTDVNLAAVDPVYTGMVELTGDIVISG